MLEFIKVIILGIIEGITEFLPISSTGHLILANEFLSFEESFEKMFNVVIQLGAILSVVVYFRRKLIPFGRGFTKIERDHVFHLWFKVLAGVIPGLIIFGLFGSDLQDLLFNPTVVAIALIVGGFIILLVENIVRKPKITSIESLSFKNAFIIGLIQCLAIIPGTSRSASTIIGAMSLGSDRETAAEFSFFLAIPMMVAASAYSIYKSGFSMTNNEINLLLVGMAVSFLVALAVIAGFMKLIKKMGFKPFGYYRIALGFIVLLYFYVIK